MDSPPTKPRSPVCRPRRGRPPRLALLLLLTACGAPASPEPFRIRPRFGPEELRARAAAATPPREGAKRTPDLVDLRTVDGLFFDIRYASTNNFLGIALYERSEAWLQRPVAEALGRAARRVRRAGYALLVHDALRPWRVTQMFWDATPPELRGFVADPALGSRHNRGCAVDVTLCDPVSGAPVRMPSGYDEFTERAAADYAGGTEEERRHRALLRTAMEAEGFSVLPEEWWHFDFQGWEAYPLLEDFPPHAEVP